MKNFFTSITFILVVLMATNSMLAGEASENRKAYYSKDPLVLNAVQNLPWTQYESLASMMMPCPNSLEFDLDFGQCGVVVPSFGFGFPDISVSNRTTNPVQNSTLINSTIYCSSGQTKYVRTFIHAGPTDMRVSTISLGVYESYNSPVVTFNFYTTGDVLLGSYAAVIPDLNLAVHTINIPVGTDIKIPRSTSYKMEVVTNAPFISVFKIGRNNAGHQPGFSEATIFASGCVVLNQEIDSGSPGITPNAVVFGLVGTPDDYAYENILNDFEEGDYFPIGSTAMAYTVTDASGASTNCAFTIDVNGFPNPTGALACQDLVQVSLDEECEKVITPDLLLQGNQYGCYDDFTVQIFSNTGANLGNVVGINQIGQKLKTLITGPNGNSCWGEILVQDKLGPTLDCFDVYVTCGTDLEPGSDLTTSVPVTANIEDGIISEDEPSVKSFIVSVKNLPSSVITDLNVYLDISHTRVRDLSINITSPNGITVPLMANPNCDEANLMMTFDDEASNPYNILGQPCSNTDPAITGSYQPINPLSIFDGLPLEGDWVINVFDFDEENGGEVNTVDLVFSQTGGFVPFPTTNEVAFDQIEEYLYRVQGIDNCGLATLSYKDEIIEEDCSSIYSKVIRRCWTGVDIRGNQGVPCCQNIYVYRNGLSTLQFPPNFDGLGNNPDPLSCVEYGSVIPSTSVTGLPTGDLCHNVQIVDPVDVRIDICEKSYKLLRTHKVVDWCSGEVIVHNQVIKVEDNQGPRLECPEDVTISTSDYTCTASYKVERPKVTAECSSNLTYVLSYNYFNDVDSEFVSTNVNPNTNVISGLVQGTNYIRWIVSDACGNSTSCTFTIFVEDNVLPNPVCFQFTVTSLTGNGRAVVDAESLNNGSVDNCAILRYDARKMTDSCGISNAIFRPEVEFCCKEVGRSVMVELRVTDVNGNINTCMVEVRIEDKLPPYITKCPADILIDCQEDYKDLNLTGSPEYIDNCLVDSVWFKDTPKINQCGVGEVTRLWTVRDKQGLRNSCTQVITLIDQDPFWVNVNNPFDPNDDIVWPQNYETKKCYSSLTPESLPPGFNRPTFNDDNCSLVSAHYKDQIFKFVDGACEKVLRTWTVIDWCTYNESNPVYGQGWYQYLQIIKLQNDVPPSYEFACEDRNFNSFGECQDLVKFTMTAIDDCPEDNVNLIWRYELFTETGLVPIATDTTNKFSRILADGKYRIRWTVEDRCGNRSFCHQNLNVRDRKKPSPYCLSSISTAVMNSNGKIAIWAKDYDLGAFDNCTPKDKLVFTFFGATPVPSKIDSSHYFIGNGELSTKAEYEVGNAQIWIPATRTSGMIFDCFDIPDGKSQLVDVEVWVTDLAGNQDFCTVSLLLEDNSDICPDITGDGVIINGRVAANNVGVEGIDVVLESNVPEYNKILKTNGNGEYSFANLSKPNKYTVSLNDNRDISNGVSTLDLVLIQRHIVGAEKFADPKQIIAADADNNQKVTASDLLNIRKVILGIVDAFPNNQKSWRFVTNNHVFTNPLEPFPFTEKYVFNQMPGSKFNQNFYGIKIGDVNQSAEINAQTINTGSRSSHQIKWAIDPISVDKHQNIRLPIYASSFEGISGFQTTFEFDASGLAFIGFEAAALEIDESNFGFKWKDKGIITASWNQDQSTHVSKDEVLFYLNFKSLRNLTNFAALKLSSKITPAIGFDDQLNEMDLVLETRKSNDSKAFELMQNQPNPFNDKTNISFVIPESGDIVLTLTDVTGKVIKVVSASFEAGLNTIEIQANELKSSGIVFYQLQCGQYVDTKKMILLE